MNEVTAQDLLDRLQSESHVVELLSIFGPSLYPQLWNDDPQGAKLYAQFARSLNAHGHPAKALDLARKGLAAFANSAELHFQVALAHARGGSLAMAEQSLAHLLNEAGSELQSDLAASPEFLKRVYALRGRLFKDACFAEADLKARAGLAELGAQWYDRAWRCTPDDFFPRINYATLLRVSGRVDQAQEVGQQIYEAFQSGNANSPDDDDWREATLAEAALLAQKTPEAIAHYESAVDQMLRQRRVGDLISVFKNLRLLAQSGAIVEPASLRARLGSVIVFSGHRIDPSDWPERKLAPRFPNDPALVQKVQEAIRAKLREMNARFGFCSLASGADILFAEEMLARDAELDVVLPFQREDFLTHCVDYGQNDPQMRAWRRRFEAIVERITPQRLHYATEEPYLGADVLYDYTNKFLQGLAKVRAGQCLIEPVALLVVDDRSSTVLGGTKSFEESWTRSGYQCERIDLAALRALVEGAAVEGTFEENKVRRSFPMPQRVQPKLTREVRAMLFADVAGFSSLREELAPDFFLEFPRVIADVLEQYQPQVLTANTWGDGFFAVLESTPDCAKFALDLVTAVGAQIPWKDWGFAEVNPLRVGVHAGPVFVLEHDPVLQCRSYCGQHINRTARIEPVTLPGCVFASEQFAALLCLAAGDQFRCDLIGTEQLAKKYAAAALYRISRASGLSATLLGQHRSS